MRYKTTNELEHFDFTESYIAEIQAVGGFFHMVLDNVTILPENSCNRDIRPMRTNNLLLKIEQGSICKIIQEGYKLYDANGKLMQAYEDVQVAAAEYAAMVKMFVDGMVYSLKKEDNMYIFMVDAPDERSYQLVVEGSGDTQGWDRFLSKEM